MTLFSFFFYTGTCAESGKRNSTKMPSTQILQTVLQMKVDELFLNWLSDPTTQTLLKDYLDLIKSGQHSDLSVGDTEEKRTLSFNENNNVASQRNLSDKKAFNTPSSPPSASTLPSGSSSSTRVTEPNGRILRRSVSTKKVNYLLRVNCVFMRFHAAHRPRSTFNNIEVIKISCHRVFI